MPFYFSNLILQFAYNKGKGGEYDILFRKQGYWKVLSISY